MSKENEIDDLESKDKTVSKESIRRADDSKKRHGFVDKLKNIIPNKQKLQERRDINIFAALLTLISTFLSLLGVDLVNISIKRRAFLNEIDMHFFQLEILNFIYFSVTGFIFSVLADSYTGKPLFVVISSVFNLIFSTLCFVLYYYSYLNRYITQLQVTLILPKLCLPIIAAYVLEQVILPEGMETLNILAHCYVIANVLPECVSFIMYIGFTYSNDWYFDAVLYHVLLINAIIATVLNVISTWKCYFEKPYTGIGFKIHWVIMYTTYLKMKGKESMPIAIAKFGKYLVFCCRPFMMIMAVMMPSLFCIMLNEMVMDLARVQSYYVLGELPVTFEFVSNCFTVVFLIMNATFLRKLTRRMRVKAADLVPIISGYCFIGIGILVSAFMQVPIGMREELYPKLEDYGQLRIFNHLNTSTKIQLPWSSVESLPPYHLFQLLHIPSETYLSCRVKIENYENNVRELKSISSMAGASYSYVIGTKGIRKVPGKDPISPLRSPLGAITYVISDHNETVISLRSNSLSIFLTKLKEGDAATFLLKPDIYVATLFDLRKQTVTSPSQSITIEEGGIYAFVTLQVDHFFMYTVVEPHSFYVHFFYPHIIILAFGQSLLFPNVMSFMFKYSPRKLRAITFAYFYLIQNCGFAIMILEEVVGTKIRMQRLIILSSLYFLLVCAFIYTAQRYYRPMFDRRKSKSSTTS